MKQKLEISTVITIDRIYSDYLSFFDNTLHKRNIAYQFQYLDFLRELYKKYELYGSVNSIFLQQTYFLIHSTAEIIMYCQCLKNNLIKKDRDGMIKYVKMARALKAGKMISKVTCTDLIKINDKRNNVHPEKQNVSHMKTYTKTDVNAAQTTLYTLLKELKEFNQQT